MTSHRCLLPYKPPEWARQLRRVPEVKVQLAMADTPIHEWNLPRVPEEFSISIKRDDMTGSTLSGNKVRKLEFLMADALKQGCRHVITCGSIQSNHCRAVVVCARQLGLTPHIFLRTDAEDADGAGYEGNVLIDRLCGSHIYLVPRKSPYVTHLKPRMEKLASDIKASTGEESYLIPVGGSTSVGLFGYITVFQEMERQGVLEEFDDVVFACGSGGTASGLAIGNYLTGSKLKIHAIAVSDDAAYFHNHCNETLQEVGLENLHSEDILHIAEGHKGKGYGISTDEELEFIFRVAQNTGVLLDPTYSGKAVLGLVRELTNNASTFRGNRVLFLHTGGVYGLFDGRMASFLQQQQQQLSHIKMWRDVCGSPVEKS